MPFIWTSGSGGDDPAWIPVLIVAAIALSPLWIAVLLRVARRGGGNPSAVDQGEEADVEAALRWTDRRHRGWLVLMCVFWSVALALGLLADEVSVATVLAIAGALVAGFREGLETRI